MDEQTLRQTLGRGELGAIVSHLLQVERRLASLEDSQQMLLADLRAAERALEDLWSELPPS